MNGYEPCSQMSVQSGLVGVEAWLFDLDNTLYPAASNLFNQIDQRMGAYISNLLGISRQHARDIQKSYYRDFGTTLNGLMHNHSADPDAYLEYVHDIDLTVISAAPSLASALSQLPGRKIVFTNGSTVHAERVMTRLGIAKYFEGIHDIKASEYKPKPDYAAYHSVISRFQLTPGSLIMVDDIPANLEPASALGVTTVWVRNDGWARQAVANYIDHVTDNLAEWLTCVVAKSDATVVDEVESSMGRKY